MRHGEAGSGEKDMPACMPACRGKDLALALANFPMTSTLRYYLKALLDYQVNHT